MTWKVISSDKTATLDGLGSLEYSNTSQMLDCIITLISSSWSTNTHLRQQE
jgi:hypothetical protein